VKCEVEREELLRACLAASKAVPSRSVRAILSCLHLQAGDEGLTVTGTDLETTIESSAACAIHEDGAAAIPTRQLLEMLRRCGSGPIHLTTTGATLGVAWGKAKFSLQGQDATEYPKVEWPKQWVPAAGVRDAMEKVCFAAASGTEARALLTGVNLTEAGALATDGFQVAHLETELKIESVTLPAENIQTVLGVMPEGELDIVQEKAGVFFRVGDIRVRLRAIEGKFFDVLSLVPKEWKTSVAVDRRALLGALLRVSTLVEQEPPHVLTIQVKNDSLELTARSELGEGAESVDAKVTGPRIRLSVNCKQMAEGLRALGGETVTVSANKGNELTAWNDGSNLHFYQMPLQMPNTETKASA